MIDYSFYLWYNEYYNYIQLQIYLFSSDQNEKETNPIDDYLHKMLFFKWILTAENSRLSDYRECASTFMNWGKSILNTFDYPYTNGFTEGCNNKIKVLKRNAYGYRNFERFRKRILHMFNYKKTDKLKAVA